MFEKFTEKALNVIVEAQNIAIYDHSDKVLSEHLLLALIKETKGFCAKIFKSYNLTYERLAEEIYLTLNMEEADMNSSIPFSEDFKRILQQTMDLVEKSGSPTVHYEHLVLAAINDKHSKISEYLEHLNFDIEKSKPLIEKLVQRKTKQDMHYEHLVLAAINDKHSKISEYLEHLNFDIEKSKPLIEKLVQRKTKQDMHPELDENREKEVNLTQETDSLFENKESSKVFERAVSKLSTSGYEILGTEQIISSILEDKDSNLTKILADFGVTEELFEEKLSKIQSRQAEYEGRQIVFTPNAFTAMSLALQTAKELGSSEVLPEHMILQKSNPVRLNTKADKLFLHQMHLQQ